MKRRHFLQTTGLALGSVLIGKLVSANNSGILNDIISCPDQITALSAGNEVNLLKRGTGNWEADNISVSLINTKNSIEVFVNAPKAA